MKRRIAVIPARSGSKGLPDKNILPLCGKPLMVYTIDAAIQSGLFDVVHVSTDSEIYADIAKKHGADVKFLRSVENSGDVASSWETMREVIRKYEQVGEAFTHLCVLQPTSPLRNYEDIIGAVNLYEQKNATLVDSVTALDHPQQWSFRLDDSCSMADFSKNPYRNKQRQELTTYYRENGAIYYISVEKLFEEPFDVYEGRPYAYVMERTHSIDIDSKLDFQLAEMMIRK